MTMIVVTTQYMENYGSADEPYWKFKGGADYKITNVPLNIDYNAVISAANIGYNNPMAREYVMSWSVESDDYLSEFERSQLEYDGRIVYPEPTLSYQELVAEASA
jgi:hypothetical protein